MSEMRKTDGKQADQVNKEITEVGQSMKENSLSPNPCTCSGFNLGPDSRQK